MTPRRKAAPLKSRRRGVPTGTRKTMPLKRAKSVYTGGAISEREYQQLKPRKKIPIAVKRKPQTTASKIKKTIGRAARGAITGARAGRTIRKAINRRR